MPGFEWEGSGDGGWNNALLRERIGDVAKESTDPEAAEKILISR